MCRECLLLLLCSGSSKFSLSNQHVLFLLFPPFQRILLISRKRRPRQRSSLYRLRRNRHNPFLLQDTYTPRPNCATRPPTLSKKSGIPPGQSRRAARGDNLCLRFTREGDKEGFTLISDPFNEGLELFKVHVVFTFYVECGVEVAPAVPFVHFEAGEGTLDVAVGVFVDPFEFIGHDHDTGCLWRGRREGRLLGDDRVFE